MIDDSATVSSHLAHRSCLPLVFASFLPVLLPSYAMSRGRGRILRGH